MNIKQKTTLIFLNTLPIILMIGLIPFVENDYLLTGIYLLIIFLSFAIKHEKKDHIFFIFGFVVMIFSEYFFISTGVETFARNSLFGLMPLWLPFLWAYAFIAIRRANIILDK